RAAGGRDRRWRIVSRVADQPEIETAGWINMDVTGIEIGLGLTLAQDDAPIQTVPGDQPGGEGTSAPPPARPAPSPMTNLIFWIPLLLVFVFLIWSRSSAQRKEKKRREQMLSTIKKHDRVQT